MLFEYDTALKAVLIGQKGSGIRCLGYRLSKDEFTDYNMLGVEYIIKKYKDANDLVHALQLVMMPLDFNLTRCVHRDIQSAARPGSAIYCFDLSDKEGFEHTLQQLKNHRDGNAYQTLRALDFNERNIFLLGTKLDCADTELKQKLNDIALEYNLTVGFCSAKTGEGVGDFFKDLPKRHYDEAQLTKALQQKEQQFVTDFFKSYKPGLLGGHWKNRNPTKQEIIEYASNNPSKNTAMVVNQLLSQRP